MIKWFSRFFKPAVDRIEQDLLEQFGFLINDYGFLFSKEALGNLVDENGKLIFYGPLDAYQFYNENICINILYLVQRDEYSIYLTNEKKADQIYLRSGTEVPSYLEYDLPLFAVIVKESILNKKELFGHTI